MADPLIIAQDVGTSATKTTLVRTDGTVVDSESTPHETNYPGPLQAEQNAEDWWSGVCANTSALLERHPDAADRVAVVGVSGHMLGCLPVDEGIQPLRPCMIHSDSRAKKPFQRVVETVGKRAMYELTGNILDPRSSLCKMLWLQENEPDVYRRAHRFLQSKDFVVARLTGNSDTGDYSDASHAQVLDVKTWNYADDVLGDLGLDVAKLPELHRGVDVVGRITAQAAGQTGLPQGTPVVAGGGDGACATLGAGVAAPGCAYCCMGSTAWIACATQEPYIDEHARVFNILNMDGETNGVYGTVQAAGSSLEWIREVFGGIEFQEMEAAARQADPGSGKLVFLPYLEGERSPIWDSHARGVFFGLSPMHGRARMVRAVVEGVCYALRSVLDVFREDYDLDELRIIGGGARSELWRRTLADVCRARLHTLTAPSEHGTALGAALTAGVGVGIFSSLTEAAGQIAERETVVPDGERSAVYEPLYDFYLSLYPEMKDAFARLDALGA